MFKKKPPYLMFNGTDPAPAGGGTGTVTPPATPPAPTPDPAPAATPPANDPGFPANTPLAEMTAEQQAAYWRNESKKHQKTAESFTKSGLTPDEVQAVAAQRERDRQAAMSDADRAAETARAEGRAQAETSHLTSAVEAQVAAMTMRPGEDFAAATARVKGALEFVDVRRFVDENGVLDANKIQTFAGSLGTSAPAEAPQPGGDPLTRVLMGHQPPAPSAGSVTSYEDATYKRLTGQN